MADDKSGRLRRHPEERFRAPQHEIDLEQAAAELAAEPVAAPHRHRQKTLYRHAGLTLALFLFDEGAGLAEHKADGVVTIQVLQGRLKVSSEGQDHHLSPGQLLVLAPGVRHDVFAEQSSRTLLTVSREPK